MARAAWQRMIESMFYFSSNFGLDKRQSSLVLSRLRMQTDLTRSWARTSSDTLALLAGRDATSDLGRHVVRELRTTKREKIWK